MTTKPPASGLANGTGSSSDEETIDDSLDEILLEAHEKPLENPILPPQGIPKLQLPQGGSATLLGTGMSPLPLPGVAPGPPSSADEMTPPPPLNPDEATQIARPSLLDEATDDEETKVGPAESARRAAAANRETDEELEMALTDQANAEREKALRRSAPPAPRISSSPSSEVEFQDPDDYDGPPLAHDTPSTIPLTDDDDDESTANGRGPLTGSGSTATSPPPLGGSRLPPTGAPFGTRLPTPSGLRVPSPALGLPAGNPGFNPSASPPFGLPAGAAGAGYGTPGASGSYAPPVPSSPFAGVRTNASSPAVPIPAPSGLPATSRSAVFSKIQLPVGGLVMFLVAAFTGGVVFGAILWRSGSAEPAVVAVPAQQPAAAPQAAVPAPPPPPAPVVQPVEPPAPPPPPAAAQDEATPEAVAAERMPQPVAARPARRVTPPVTGPVKASRPRKTASAGGPSKQVDSRGVAKGWVDPFAQ